MRKSQKRAVGKKKSNNAKVVVTGISSKNSGKEIVLGIKNRTGMSSHIVVATGIKKVSTNNDLLSVGSEVLLRRQSTKSHQIKVFSAENQLIGTVKYEATAATTGDDEPDLESILTGRKPKSMERRRK